MAAMSMPHVPVAVILIAIVAVYAIQRIYYEMTTGARRRQMIKDNGCEEIPWYPHQGILGKLYGVDRIKDMVAAAKQGRMNEATRIKNFGDGKKTLRLRLASSNIISTIEPESIKTVLSTKFQDYSLGERRKEVFLPVFGHGIFANDGAAWERSRALVRPNFTRQQVADLDMFEVHMSHLIDSIARDGSTVDLQDLFFGLTMDSATEFLFGKSTNTLAPGLETKSANEFVKAFVYVSGACAKDFRSGGLAKFIPDARWRKSVKIMHNFADAIIHEAIEELRTGKQDPNGRYIFLHALLRQTQDPYVVRSELLNILLAGRDTTAGLLSNTWHVLSKRPEVFAKLKAEVDQLGGAKPDYTTIKEMKYLKWTLNESLRLMPVVPSNSREAIRDTVLPLGGGADGKAPALVRKGEVVGYSAWSMHRREDFYGPDALEFKPERWERLRPGWEYLPFNGGPRICVGQQYALMEASYATIRLIQTFPRIESRDDEEWREWMTITLASGTGVKVALFEK
ncbi:Cytochrome P450 [Cladophialophora carrionii]|uniref:Cytochrome P450 n=1 Tax=Cladophialophora carrionii TaxID=86049 RepID=A0A1C1D235_9EURO|nr:Cytochrome P450 [Cladophialophora carrionii]